MVKPPALNIDGSLECFFDGILRLAQLFLRLAGQFFGLAFSLKLVIAGDLAGCFLDRALCLTGDTFDTVIVHDELLPSFERAAVGNGMMER
ncbi:conserved hypothetical protein [Agrobacterium genomosp. 2 str. CFBP 5494]|uniref:Uncharacterized protein n=1 Tax=Agrobacterium genomosp. 2 str. CFBP 5494 TaxID=1183436 RepID=A0A9W5F1N6_9HYPH|nr:conserved hypothetical protein [Agrobacterium genomosp. 2 str. CFBP 5494]